MNIIWIVILVKRRMIGDINNMSKSIFAFEIALLIILFCNCSCNNKKKVLQWAELDDIEDSCSIEPSAIEYDSAVTIESDSIVSFEEKESVSNTANSSLEQPYTPQSISSVPISHIGYTLSYNLTTHCPNWVAWELTAEEANGRYPRSNDYKEDPSIENAKDRVNEKAYSSVSYDRGHMCPAGDMKWSAEAMSASFYMTNMCPQDNSLNNGAWKRLEEACRRWAGYEGKVYICCGPIFKGKEEVIDNNPQITIPSAFFKVVLSTKEGHEKAIGFYFENNDKRQTVGNAVRTVDEIEEITGFDFFPQLDDEIENKVESYAKLSKWN